MSKRLNDAFINLPAPFVPKSYHNLSHSLVTSMNVGKLYPIDWQEVLPGDIFKVKDIHVSKVTSSFIRPVMDNLYIDIYHFYVPLKQVFDDADSVFGDPRPSAYTAENLSVIPSISGANIVSGSVGDYLGLPVGMINNNVPISALPFRAFAHIYNSWFRNENINDEVSISFGELTSNESPNASDWSATNYYGMPPSVPKYKDYFTSALPSPQKGNTVELSFSDISDSSMIDGVLPVRTYETRTFPSTQTNLTRRPLRFDSGYGGFVGSQAYPLYLYNDSSISGYKPIVYSENNSVITPTYNYGVVPSNLGVNISDIGVNINDLRFAEAYQHDLELNAMYGTRYNEYLLSHFGIYSDDLEVGIPKYLGGDRTPVSILQVEQTSDNLDENNDGQLGRLGAYSSAVGKGGYKYRFKYHGIVMTVGCLRYKHTYQQGVACKWQRFNRDDFYNPSFAYIGMQPIKQSEIYGVGSSTSSDTVFGYKPAWNEYRFEPNIVTGQARSTTPDGKSLDIWHFADEYSSAPVLSSDFINENGQGFARTVGADPDIYDPFIFSFYFDILARRPITEYAEPSINVRRW